MTVEDGKLSLVRMGSEDKWVNWTSLKILNGDVSVVIC